jgi:hypothetical protein
MHYQRIINASSTHYQRIINVSSTHHERIINALSTHYQRIINASPTHFHTPTTPIVCPSKKLINCYINFQLRYAFFSVLITCHFPAHHQCIINTSSTHHQRIINASSTHHQCAKVTAKKYIDEKYAPFAPL